MICSICNYQWIGLGEDLQEHPMFYVDFPLNQSIKITMNGKVAQPFCSKVHSLKVGELFILTFLATSLSWWLAHLM